MRRRTVPILAPREERSAVAVVVASRPPHAPVGGSRDAYIVGTCPKCTCATVSPAVPAGGGM